MDKDLREFGNKMAFLIPRISRAFMRKGGMAEVGDISFSQVVVLEFLREKRVCKMNDIAKNFSVTTSAVTGLVDRMVKSRLLERGADPADRRVVLVKMTKNGEEAVNKLTKARTDMIMSVFGKLTRKERSAYIGILEKVHGILTSRKDQ
jgi:DNA-binding MarR family transcriptional regulator